jgi:hypothetical protein
MATRARQGKPPRSSVRFLRLSLAVVTRQRRRRTTRAWRGLQKKRKRFRFFRATTGDNHRRAHKAQPAAKSVLGPAEISNSHYGAGPPEGRVDLFLRRQYAQGRRPPEILFVLVLLLVLDNSGETEDEGRGRRGRAPSQQRTGDNHRRAHKAQSAAKSVLGPAEIVLASPAIDYRPATVESCLGWLQRVDSADIPSFASRRSPNGDEQRDGNDIHFGHAVLGEVSPDEALG